MPPLHHKRSLTFASLALLIGSADTYVVVLALPAMLGDLGLSLDNLDRATPIISGFLLGYVVLMPVLGRISDYAGRRGTLLACIFAFMFGSFMTATGGGMGGITIGRALQGLGAGGLIPVTLAMVADFWSAEHRNVPLGIVGAVQEIGSVIGPLYGAAIISVATWRWIFWLNLPLMFLITAGVCSTASPGEAWRNLSSHKWRWAAFAATVVVAALAYSAPAAIANSVFLGLLYVPLFSGWPFVTPISLIAVAGPLVFLLFAVSWSQTVFFWRAIDGFGATLLALVLGCIVVSFATVDPSQEIVSANAAFLLPVAALCAIGFVLWERHALSPIIPAAAVRSRAAYGAILTNLFVGTALIAVLVDVPIFARITAYPDSQFSAAVVLLRLLIAVPVGAIVGGWLTNLIGSRITAWFGMILCALGIFAMTFWQADALGAGFRPSDVVLPLCGLGFGLAIAPVNSSILFVSPRELHGVASSLVIAARMIGMLVGISVLTVIGLHAFYSELASIPSPLILCPSSPLACPDHDRLLQAALITEMHTVFTAAAITALIAAALSLATLAPKHKGVSDLVLA